MLEGQKIIVSVDFFSFIKKTTLESTAVDCKVSSTEILQYGLYLLNQLRDQLLIIRWQYFGPQDGNIRIGRPLNSQLFGHDFCLHWKSHFVRHPIGIKEHKIRKI